MISVAEARARILAAVPLMPIEEIPLDAAHGRALAGDVVAERAQPPFNSSAMDGYAVRAADLSALPARLKLVGTIAAGQGYDGTVEAGQAVRLFTGAPVPAGADTVVIQENTEAEGATVVVHQAAESGRNIRPLGHDFAEGETVLAPGRILTAADLALAAAANAPTLRVRRRPQVAILATGDELVRPGEKPNAAQIISCNNVGLAAIVRAAGGEPVDLGIAPDRPDAIAERARAARGLDMLLTIGGASVGDHDLIRPTLAREGFLLDFWRIAVRPGKPLIFGTWDGQPVIGLPGNPVSALVCALLFLRPAILAALGLPTALPMAEVVLGADLPANANREHYMRARLETNPSGRVHAVPAPSQDSAMLTALAGADFLIRREPEAPAARRGDVVTGIPLAGIQ